MSEESVIQQGSIYTQDALLLHLRDLGVQEGNCVCVHTAMSKMGWVCGGEQAVVQALLQAVGNCGTLVMPAQCGSNSEPSLWQNPPVPKGWQRAIRDNMPAFDVDKSPTRKMGRVAELFRKWPGTLRSNNPMSSFVANGPLAESITRVHPYDYSLGDGTPCEVMYDINTKVLLIGVSYDNCTIMHLGENRYGRLPIMKGGCAVMESGQRVWKQYEDYELDSERFIPVGQSMEQSGLVKRGFVGDANALLFNASEAVDATLKYLKENL
mgnify:CR=1 FL=1